MTEENKEVVRRYREIYNSDDLDRLGDVLSTDWSPHAWVEGLPRSIEGAKELHRMTLSMFPGWHFTTLDLIAEGDRVVERFRFEGVHGGDYGGLPPTGNHFSVEGISIFRIRDGKIVEHWAFVDELGFLEALGFAEHLGIELPPAWNYTKHNHTPSRAAGTAT
jgi:predicted ester cyclase